MSVDNEVQKKSRSELMRDLVHHEGFKYIEQIFIDKIMDLQSIMNLPTDSSENVLVDIKVRINVINELKETLATIKGEANVADFDEVATEEPDLYIRE